LLRVTVELIPHGFGTPEVLKTFFIVNDGSGSKTTGNYKVAYTPRRILSGVYGEVKGHKRNAESVLRLVAKAANALCDAYKNKLSKKEVV